MATLTQNNLSLLEIAKRKDPKGNSIAIAEVLQKHTPIMMDAVWREANGASYHKFTRRAYVPAGTKRGTNQGVVADSSKTTEHTAQIAIFQNYSDIDQKLLEMSANPAETRMYEGKGVIQGLGQSFETELLYGSLGTDPNGFEGLANMLGTLALDNVIGAGGTATNTSIYAVNWGIGKTYCVYPKGSPTAGIEHKDLGFQTKTYYDTDAANGSQYMYQVSRDLYGINGGIVVEDPRSIGRIANINASNGVDEDDFIDLLAQFRNPGASDQIVFYCNRAVWAQVNKLAFGASATLTAFYPVTDPFGNVVSSFMGYPVKLAEQITNSEDTVPAS